ncbi:DUF2785 domain-containing protein [Candidatus Bipolaricaulota bacterium]|nr:DUF2785 domain-containing protein [Candidatus Bipolaricaulota bacterium]
MVNASIRQTFLDIAKNEYAVPQTVDPTKFILNSIPLLGESEGEFRERYVYGTLHRWIVSEAVDAQGLREIHLALLDDATLFSGIGEVRTESAFLRAFVVLLLVPTLYMHRKQPFLSVDEIKKTSTDLARYLREEKDHRGYVSADNWWAHGVAHAADAVGQLVQCSELHIESMTDLLEAIAQAMCPDSEVYAHEEDARMAAAVLKLFKRNVWPPEAIEHWLGLVVPKARFEGELPQVHIRFVNARNFLRCLYFQAKEEELANEQIALIEAALAAFPNR